MVCEAPVTFRVLVSGGSEEGASGRGETNSTKLKLDIRFLLFEDHS